MPSVAFRGWARRPLTPGCRLRVRPEGGLHGASVVSVIVPTLNEAESLPILVERIASTMGPEPYELVVVDDDSPDRTWAVARALSGRYPVAVLRRTGKTGLASAVADGFGVAGGDLLCVMDADLSHPPEVLPALIAAVRDGGADMAIASRLVPGGGTEGWPQTRKLTSRVATLLARPLTAVRDPMSGFFVVRREVLTGVRLKPRGYKIGLEIVVKGRPRRIVEIPFVFRDRSAGVSKLGVRQNLEYLAQLLELYRHALGRFLWPRTSR